MVRRGALIMSILSKSFVFCPRLVEKDAPKDDIIIYKVRALLTMNIIFDFRNISYSLCSIFFLFCEKTFGIGGQNQRI